MSKNSHKQTYTQLMEWLSLPKKNTTRKQTRTKFSKTDLYRNSKR